MESKEIPQSVQKLRVAAEKSDALLLGIPEYNFSMSSPFKNVYDWLSREYPNSKSPVEEKIAAMVSSGGGKGGKRAQDHFLDSAKFRKVKVMSP